MARRGAGFSADSGILFSEDTEVGDTGSTGFFVEAAVDGFASCVGDGWRLIEADCIVEAISTAGFDMVAGPIESAVLDYGKRGPARSYFI